MEKIIRITVFRAKMESIFCWTALTSANILLCLLPPTHGLQFPSIFWIGFGFGWQPAGSLSRAGAGEPRGCHLFSAPQRAPGVPVRVLVRLSLHPQLRSSHCPVGWVSHSNSLQAL